MRDNYEWHYELKGRMSLVGEWYVIGYANSKEHLDSMVERQKTMWRYLTWNSYRAGSVK